MGCFPTDKTKATDSNNFFTQPIPPSTEMGNSLKLSNNPKSNEIISKGLFLRRKTTVETKYSIIKRENLEFSDQYKVISKETSKPFLMTLISKVSIIKEAEFLHAIHLLIKFKGNHFITIVEYFEDNINYYIIYDYYEEQNLFNQVSALRLYNETVIANIAYVLLETMDELALSQINSSMIHPKRIYFNEDPKTKEIQIKINSLCYLEEYVSSPVEDNYNLLFSSPELLSSSQKGNHSLVWSIGVILFCLLIGDIPFNGITKEEVVRSIKSKAHIKAIDSASISAKAKLFLKDSLAIDYKKRIDAKTILFHPFFECLHNKDRTNTALINTTTLSKIKAFYAKMHFAKCTSAFINTFLEMRAKINELIPRLKELIEQNDSEGAIEEAIGNCFGSSINKMKIIRVKEEAIDLQMNCIEFINGLTYNWHKINRKYHKKGFHQLLSFRQGSVNKSELAAWLSYSKAKEIFAIKSAIEATASEILTFDEFELAAMKALTNEANDDKKETIQEIIGDKMNENIFKDKWPFADNSYEIDIMTIEKLDADSSKSSSDDS